MLHLTYRFSSNLRCSHPRLQNNGNNLGFANILLLKVIKRKNMNAYEHTALDALTGGLANLPSWSLCLACLPVMGSMGGPRNHACQLRTQTFPNRFNMVQLVPPLNKEPGR